VTVRNVNVPSFRSSGWNAFGYGSAVLPQGPLGGCKGGNSYESDIGGLEVARKALWKREATLMGRLEVGVKSEGPEKDGRHQL
jgi:hypothetical protein